MKTHKILTTLGVALAMAASTPTAHAQRRQPARVTIPAGTLLNVRLTQMIDADFAATGSTYGAVLDDPVSVDGSIVIPRGAQVVLQAVAVKQSGKLKGSDKITFKANSLSFRGVTYDIATSHVQTRGKGEGKRTAKRAGIGAGIGAAVGGIFGGGSGAAIGAAAGGTTGVVTGDRGGEHLMIPAETWFQFRLNTSLSVRE